MKNIVEKECPEFPYFGATYPDATCIDGQLYDLDKCDEGGNLYEMSEYHPCPFCNKEEFMKQQMEDENDIELVEKWIENMRQKYSY